MTIADAAALAERFLREHIASLPSTDDFTFALKRVEHDGERTLRAVFGVSIALTPRELRPADRINECLRAMLSAQPSLRPYRIDVTAGRLDDE